MAPALKSSISWAADRLRDDFQVVQALWSTEGESFLQKNATADLLSPETLLMFASALWPVLLAPASSGVDRRGAPSLYRRRDPGRIHPRAWRNWCTARLGPRYAEWGASGRLRTMPLSRGWLAVEEALGLPLATSISPASSSLRCRAYAMPR